VPVILAELKGEGKIRIRPIGRVKLHYWENMKLKLRPGLAKVGGRN
jgi:hypothetical protein